MKRQYKDISQPIEDLAMLVYNHFGKKPMGWTGIDKLTEYAHNEQFVRQVLELYEYLLQSDEFLYGINPSQYYKIIYKFQLASKSMDIDINTLTSCYFYLANYAIGLYNHNYNKIKESVRNMEFYEIKDRMLAQSIALLSAVLRSYSETLYCDEHTISGEIYSPVDMGDDVIIARKYRWLNAVELREELKDFPYKSVDIYVKYSGLKIPPNTDIVGNLLISENLMKHMRGFYVEVLTVDNELQKIESVEKIEEIITYFQGIIPVLIYNYRKMKKGDRLWEKILCEYYAMKPYTDICNKDWHPSKYTIDVEVIADKKRPIVYANTQIENTKDDQIIKQKLFELNDPRVHWNEKWR